MKLYRTDGELIIDLPQYETVKEAVEHCVKNDISLTGADLYKADLGRADLRGANLEGADLREADLYGANLAWANLRWADLRWADLGGAKGIYTFNKLGGRTCYAVVHDKELMIQAGCFWGNLTEFETACKAKYPDDSVQAYEAQIYYLKVLQNEKLYLS